jgi:hypothetical protein
MLDPKEQKKGGFGAFAQRDRERRDAEKDVSSTGGAAAPASPSSSERPEGTVPGTTDQA